MSDLPSRDSFKRSGVTLMDAKPILAAYVRGELKTEAEWREAIEPNDAIAVLVKRLHEGTAIGLITRHDMRLAIAAALGVKT